MKKIAVVIPKYGLVGGGELFASEVTERLARNNQFDVHVFANKWKVLSDNITFHKVPIISFPKWLTTISFAFFANRKIAKGNFDLIHTHDRIFKADIFTMHGIPHRIWVSKVRKKRMSLFDMATAWVEKQLVLHGECKKFLSVSSLAQDNFLEEYRVEKKRTGLFHPGVDLEKFNFASRSESRANIRKAYGISPEDIVILFVSMNFELKGLDLILSAVAQIDKAQQGRIKILVVGKGNQDKFTKIAAHHQLEKNLIFAGVWHEKIEQVYCASDLFAMLSKFDTFGMSVLEAMTAALPVIISDKVGAKDIVSEGKNGFIVDRANITQIKKRIIHLLDDHTRGEMGKNALAAAQANSWKHNTKNIHRLWTVINS